MSIRSTPLNQLRQLFPNVETQVIECVFIANENQFDVTIDHLLKMSSDDKNENFQSPANSPYDDEPPPYPGLKHRYVASSLPRRAHPNDDHRVERSNEREKPMREENLWNLSSSFDSKTLRKTRIHSPMLQNFIRKVDKGEKFTTFMIVEEPMANRNDYSYGRDPLNYFRREF